MIFAIAATVVAFGGLFIVVGATDAGRKLILAGIVFSLMLPLLCCFGGFIGARDWPGAVTLLALMFGVGWWRVAHKEKDAKLLRQNARAKWVGRELKRRIEKVN